MILSSIDILEYVWIIIHLYKGESSSWYRYFISLYPLLNLSTLCINAHNWPITYTAWLSDQLANPQTAYRAWTARLHEPRYGGLLTKTAILKDKGELSAAQSCGHSPDWQVKDNGKDGKGIYWSAERYQRWNDQAFRESKDQGADTLY